MKGNYQTVRDDCIPQKNVILNKPDQPKWFNKNIAKQIGEREKCTSCQRPIPHKKILKFTGNNAEKLIEWSKRES